MLTWSWIRNQLLAHRAALRFCLRTTVAALIAFGLMQFWSLPFRGLWAVLTAVVVMQMSVGGSIRATTEYVVGTFGGAVYASVLGVLVPHTTLPALMGVLAIAVAPLAYAAALSPSFRVAPFTAVLVLLLAGQFGQGGTIASAFARLGEVVLGGMVAVLVSLFVLPERAHGLGLDAAERALNRLADALPLLLSGFTRQLVVADIFTVQDSVGHAVTAFQSVLDEARREQFVGLSIQPDLGSLSRTLLRLRHDLIIVGRAAVAPLPDMLGQRLQAHLAEIAAAARDELRAAAAALTARRPPPDSARVEAAVDAFAAEMAALRRDGLTRPLSESEAEQLFALSFGLEELRQNMRDLARCVAEWSGRGAAPTVLAPRA
jgi:uncharacterized membrane protein YccC